jgi:hypothetical protein
MHGKALQLEKYSARGLGFGKMAECFLKRRAKPIQILEYFCDFAVKTVFRGIARQAIC